MFSVFIISLVKTTLSFLFIYFINNKTINIYHHIKDIVIFFLLILISNLLFLNESSLIVMDSLILLAALFMMKNIPYLHAIFFASSYFLMISVTNNILNYFNINDFITFLTCYMLLLFAGILYCIIIFRLENLIPTKKFNHILIALIITNTSLSIIYLSFNYIYLIFLLVFLFFICTIVILVSTHLLNEKKETKENIYQFLSHMFTTQTKEMISDQKNANLLIHDTKNNLLEIYDSLKRNDIVTAENLVKNWLIECSSANQSPVCINPYLHIILKKKIEFYKECQFNLKIQVSENIPIDTIDLFILTSYIIDNASTNSNKKINLVIKNNDYELSIHESHLAQDFQENPLLLDIIKWIVEKYNGDIQITKKEKYEMIILLFLK